MSDIFSVPGVVPVYTLSSIVAIPLGAESEKSYRAVEKYVDQYGGRYEGLLRNHAGRYDPSRDHHRFTISQAEYTATVTDG